MFILSEKLFIKFFNVFFLGFKKNLNEGMFLEMIKGFILGLLILKVDCHEMSFVVDFPIFFR